MARVILDSLTHSSWQATAAGADAPSIVAAALADVPAALAALAEQSCHRRWAGFFSYDLGRSFETLPNPPADDLHLPLLAFSRCDDQVAPAADPLRKSIDRANQPASLAALPTPATPARSNFSRHQYEQAVEHCLAYIRAGDVFQINLSQRLEVPTAEAPATIYQRLRQYYPAEFGALLAFDRFALLSNSPELFLRVRRLPDGRRLIQSRPIKGTRPNQRGMAEALLTSVKDQAELAMIVDLQRNDLGRLCQTGSVRVTQPRVIETHPTVLHGVASIEGVLRPGISLGDILAATFPCGSVTGCPKIRAMQIIDELEPVARGAYCGAIGWIEGDELELSVAIRTMTIQDGVAYVPVGGGVVADSTPAAEYDETLVKAKAMLAALGANAPA